MTDKRLAVYIMAKQKYPTFRDLYEDISDPRQTKTDSGQAGMTTI